VELSDNMQLAQRKWLSAYRALMGLSLAFGLGLLVAGSMAFRNTGNLSTYTLFFSNAVLMCFSALALYVCYRLSYKRHGTKVLTCLMFASTFSLAPFLDNIFDKPSWSSFAQLGLMAFFVLWFFKESVELRKCNREVQKVVKQKQMQSLNSQLEKVERGFFDRLQLIRKKWLRMFKVVLVWQVLGALLSFVIDKPSFGTPLTEAKVSPEALIAMMLILTLTFSALYYRGLYRFAYKEYGIKFLAFNMSIIVFGMFFTALGILATLQIKEMTAFYMIRILTNVAVSCWAFSLTLSLWKVNKELQESSKTV
jgi:hypothetical protein